MFVLRRGQIRSTTEWFMKKRLSKRHFFSSSSAEPATVDENQRGDLGSSKKSFKQPFLSNLLVGKFDQDFLVYPEVVDLDELQQHIIQNVDIGSSQSEGAVTQSSVQDKVKSLFKSNIPLVSNSKCNESGRLKTYELLDLDLQTSLLMETQSLIISLLSNYGSDYIKSKYLNKLMSGEITAAFAMSEACTGSDPSSIETIAELDGRTGCYILNGEKEWVTNGKGADIYVVFGTTEPLHGAPRREVTGFVVEKQSEGISVQEQSPCALNDCGISKIKLSNTLVEAQNLLGEEGQGYEIIAQSVSHNRYFVVSGLLNTMKNTLKEVHHCIKSRKQFPVALRDCELIQYKLSEICTSIYAMESMMYLHTGMIDSYDIDMTLESASLQLFCYETALETVKVCNEILGGKSYDSNYHYMKLSAEIHGLILASKTKTLLQLFISMRALAFAANVLNEKIIKNRNPLDYPGFVLKQILRNSKHQKDNPSLNLQLYMNLHPSLKDSAEILEYSALRVQYAFETLLTRYGKDTVNKQMDLCRLADVMTEVFAMTSVLGRASRSYCTGIRFADQEMLLANAFCRDSYHRVKLKILQVVDGGVVSNDVGRLKIGTEVVNLGGYFPEHPLVRNIK